MLDRTGRPYKLKKTQCTQFAAQHIAPKLSYFFTVQTLRLLRRFAHARSSQ